MTRITLEGVQWDTETPSCFTHDDVVIYYNVSQLSGRRWWAIGDVDVAFACRSDAMRYAKNYVIGNHRSAFDA